jgi:hypothetical protein
VLCNITLDVTIMLEEIMSENIESTVDVLVANVGTGALVVVSRKLVGATSKVWTLVLVESTEVTTVAITGAEVEVSDVILADSVVETYDSAAVVCMVSEYIFEGDPYGMMLLVVLASE